METFWFEMALQSIAKNFYAKLSHTQFSVEKLLHEIVAPNSAKSLLFKKDRIEMLARIPVNFRYGQRSVWNCLSYGYRKMVLLKTAPKCWCQQMKSSRRSLKKIGPRNWQATFFEKDGMEMPVKETTLQKRHRKNSKLSCSMKKDRTKVLLKSVPKKFYFD